MNQIPQQLVEAVFSEEKNSLIAWLSEQKKNLRAWLIVANLLLMLVVVTNLTLVLRFVITYPQLVTNTILVFWIIALVLTITHWPQRPGDTFSENFKTGINPRLWEWLGDWTVELDESGQPVLSVTDSELGGIALPCLSWADYDLRFETRIQNKVTGWLIRASNLNNCVMFQLSPKAITPHFKSGGVWLAQPEVIHVVPVKVGEWFSVQTLARGSWATVYVTVGGKKTKVFEGKILASKPLIFGSMPRDTLDAPDGKQLVALEVSYRPGSFGFRLSMDEAAQFRKLKAYKLR